MTISAAEKYHAYARDCLRLSKHADRLDVRKSLIALSRAWMARALDEEKHHLDNIASASNDGVR